MFTKIRNSLQLVGTVGFMVLLLTLPSQRANAECHCECNLGPTYTFRPDSTCTKCTPEFTKKCQGFDWDCGYSGYCVQS